MKQPIILLSILIAMSSCASTKERHYIRFEETKQSQAKEPIKNLLIVGMGKLPTRFFLEKMSNRLINDFAKKGIKATYHYLGNDPANAKKQFDALSLANDVDAVMSVFQTDFAEVRQIVDEVYMFAPDPGVMHLKIKHLRFNQGFNIRLYKPKNLLQFFWGSSLNIDYDFNDPILYHTISNKMVASLRKNNLCN